MPINMFEAIIMYRCKNCGALYEEEREIKSHDCRIACKTQQLGTGYL